MIAAYAQNRHIGEVEERAAGMMDVYVSCGYLASARHFFNIVPYRGTMATWNEMILAYAQRGHVEQALGVFRLMDLEGIEPNQASFLRVFDSCAVVSALRVAGLYERSDVVALTSTYAKCGSLPHAEDLFYRVRQRCNDDAVPWTRHFRRMATTTAYCGCSTG
ncbi:pentatricopeptide repeat-containing protein At2g34400-like [Selaginella moellendorffii]|uniref:pentatricopeptide repeat-containing protein At2g34400-like n=1 Tax=Selaginella moellendorffii TaxID=88036 RepID=UPI000D1C8FE8|nr:pentatricopeptide repeat-containing protein At2g34400-like [Selaginella moellendorffii]|eukprot:XP_024545230.1 pentatricopeptide repeat-containing protein At2g34400-like [Selaginella moellendorffii]